MTLKLRTVQLDHQHMKTYDNAWANKYVRDVGWLLNRIADARKTLLELSTASTTNANDDCWCHADTRPRTQRMQTRDEHWPICQRARALYERLKP
jgi:hypothetical protein